MKPAQLLFVSLALIISSAAPGVSFAQGPPNLNRFEKATVRVFGCRSLSLERIEREGQKLYLAVPEVGHGSGLIVSKNGLILTARHVVHDTSGLAVKLPLARQAIPAVVVYEDPSADFAFIKVQGSFDNVVELPAEGNIRTLATRDSLFSIGYPLDPSASTPTTQEGIVSRVTEEGLLQTSAALNPGHSGGPAFVEDDGQTHVIGLAIARARRGEGMGFIVPVAPAVQALHHDVNQRNLVEQALQRYQSNPALWEAMERYSMIVAEMTEAFVDQANPSHWFNIPRTVDEGTPEFVRELRALAVAEMVPEAQLLIAGYLWNFFVATRDENALNACIHIVIQLRDNNATVFNQSSFAQSLARVVEQINATGGMSGPMRGPFGAGGYQQQGVLQSCGTEGAPCCGRACGEELRCVSGVCQRPVACSDEAPCAGEQICRRGFCEFAPPFPLFRFGITAGLNIDDHDQAQSVVDGGSFGALGLFQLLRRGQRNPWAFALVVGAELGLGWWRRYFAFDALADVGVRFLLGSPRAAAVFTLLYTPGVIVAEGRTSGVYLAYRAMFGIQFRRFELSLSWREANRTADSTFRMLELVASWGIR